MTTRSMFLFCLLLPAACTPLQKKVSWLESHQDPPYEVGSVLKFYAQQYDLPGLFDLDVRVDGHLISVRGNVENRASLVFLRVVLASLYDDPDTEIDTTRVAVAPRKYRDTSRGEYISDFYASPEGFMVRGIRRRLAGDQQFKNLPIYVHALGGAVSLVGPVPQRTLEEAGKRYVQDLPDVTSWNAVPARQ